MKYNRVLLNLNDESSIISKPQAWKLKAYLFEA